MATERTEEQARIDTEALKLRSRGFTYQQIADSMGVSKQGAWDRVKRALADIPREAAEEYRALECERLDALLAVATHQALTGKRSLFAIDRCIMIMDRRAKLLGLDAPIKSQVETITYDGATIEGEVAKLRRILSEHSGESVLVDGSLSETGADS